MKTLEDLLIENGDNDEVYDLIVYTLREVAFSYGYKAGVEGSEWWSRIGEKDSYIEEDVLERLKIIKPELFQNQQ